MPKGSRGDSHEKALIAAAEELVRLVNRRRFAEASAAVSHLQERLHNVENLEFAARLSAMRVSLDANDAPGALIALERALASWKLRPESTDQG
jgi:hypothetical protein